MTISWLSNQYNEDIFNVNISLNQKCEVKNSGERLGLVSKRKKEKKNG